ncbi:flavin reductase family protein [Tabrizicola thermarum]|uniref:flavin reductase family protein n=1 Tax=Tabrizicola thermarum TaxID=2670345 RepID=UPI000FFB6227|nr:flavin reductase family protein [Tabrizicola thermarum]
MRYDLDQVPEAIAYKLLAATVIPRPIAWVVTQGAQGVNGAPYSFFNVMGSAPPTVALGLMAAPGRGFKDTALNILETGEFVVNLVPERLVAAMNLTSADAPRGVDELALAGLAVLPSAHVVPPRIADSPVAFECRALSSVVTGPCQTVVIGRVLAVHIDDAYLKNPERAHVDTDALDLVARSFGAEYIRTHDRFDLPRPTWAGLKAEGKV